MRALETEVVVSAQVLLDLARNGTTVSERRPFGPAFVGTRPLSSGSFAGGGEPDEPRHAGVGRLFEQMLEVAPKAPGGTRSAMRRSASTSTSAQSRSIVVVAGRMVRMSRQDSTNPAHQILVRLRLFRFVAEPLDGAARQDARAGSLTVSRSRRARPRRPRAGTRSTGPGGAQARRSGGSTFPVAAARANPSTPPPGGPAAPGARRCPRNPGGCSPFPDAINQLDQLDQTLLTRRDVERRVEGQGGDHRGDRLRTGVREAPAARRADERLRPRRPPGRQRALAARTVTTSDRDHPRRPRQGRRRLRGAEGEHPGLRASTTSRPRS